MPGHASRGGNGPAVPPATSPAGVLPAPRYQSSYGLVGGPTAWGGSAPTPGQPPFPGSNPPTDFGPAGWEFVTPSYLTTARDVATITGTSTAQVVDASDGDDRLTLSGNGAIRVIAGAGNDVVVADGTAVLAIYDIQGGLGDDLIDLTRLTIGAKASGGLGADTLLGGAGDDSLDGGAKPHESFGGFYLDAGDLIDGGAGDDKVKGGDGADSLYGGSGADHVSGGGGDDLIVGGSGADRLSGGWGSDRFIFAPGDALVQIDDLGRRSVDTIADLQSIDLVSLGFEVRSVLGTGTAVFSTFDEAQAAASSLMAATSGTGEVVAVAAGRDTILFFSSTGGDVADSAIRLGGLPPELITTSLFG